MIKFYTEFQSYIEKSRDGDLVTLTNSNGKDIRINKNYINLLDSASEFSTTKKVNQTDLIKVLLDNPKTAMTVNYQKVNGNKSKRAYDTERQNKIKEISEASFNKLERLIGDLIDNPILDYIPGEMRTIIGYPTGTSNENGLLNFIDAEADKFPTKQVNPRTIQYVICKGVKYIRK